MTLKRIAVLCLSFATMVGYGYALASLFATSFGKGDLKIIAAGAIGGTICAVVAVKIWRSYIRDINEEARAREAEETEANEAAEAEETEADEANENYDDDEEDE